jgi:hypothetical protein
MGTILTRTLTDSSGKAGPQSRKVLATRADIDLVEGGRLPGSGRQKGEIPKQPCDMQTAAPSLPSDPSYRASCGRRRCAEELMKKIVQVIVAATGGWTYHFGVTEEQAYGILNARPGQQIRLNEPNEILTVSDTQTIYHFKQVNDGGSGEELVRSSVLRKLQDLTAERAWTDDEVGT